MPGYFKSKDEVQGWMFYVAYSYPSMAAQNWMTLTTMKHYKKNANFLLHLWYFYCVSTSKMQPEMSPVQSHDRLHHLTSHSGTPLYCVTFEKKKAEMSSGESDLLHCCFTSKVNI